jgi:hypothetical protein
LVFAVAIAFAGLLVVIFLAVVAVLVEFVAPIRFVFYSFYF